MALPVARNRYINHLRRAAAGRRGSIDDDHADHGATSSRWWSAASGFAT